MTFFQILLLLLLVVALLGWPAPLIPHRIPPRLYAASVLIVLLVMFLISIIR